MRQVRAMKIGLEAQLKCKVESDWKIMEWTRNSQGVAKSRTGGTLAEQLTSDCAAGIAPRLSWRSASR